MVRRLQATVYLFGVTLLLAGFVGGIIGQITPASALIGEWNPQTSSKIATRFGTTCAVADGKAYCWGRNQYGELGNNNPGVNSSVPVPVDTSGVLAGKTVTDIAVGSNQFACAVADGKPYCWGRNNYQQLGNGTTIDSAVPVPVDTSGVLAGKTVTEISSGDAHTCVVASGAAYCWGPGWNGRMGNNSSVGPSAPVAVYTGGFLAGKTVSDVAAGAGHGCALAEGAVYCWGSNTFGQLGNGAAADSNSLVPVPIYTAGALGGRTVAALSHGSSNSTICVIADGAPYCWGENNSGQLGNGTLGTATATNVPVAATTTGALAGMTLTSITVGNNRTCALDINGHAYCWGAFASGGTPQSGSTPIAVTTSGVLQGVKLTSIAAGDVRCAAGDNGRFYCWGSNSFGELGTNTTTSSSYPTPVLANDGLTGSQWRIYKNSNTATPGNPLATANATAQLTAQGQPFRVRFGIQTSHASGTPVAIAAGGVTLKLQYAPKAAAMCSAQTTGFADVTSTTPIAWNTNSGVTNNAPLAASPSEPAPSESITHQTYRSAEGTFTNPNVIPSGNAGIWGFSLRDNSAPFNTSYCLRLATETGNPLELPSSIPEVTTTTGELSVTVVDADGTELVSPQFQLDSTIVRTTCQSTSGMLGQNNKRVRIHNSLSATGWSATIAATNGSSASWEQIESAESYDFNDSSGSPAGCNSGLDGDTHAGQLRINPLDATLTPQSTCANTGLNLGPNEAFSSGKVDAVTLVTASSSAQTGCYWDLTGVGLTQMIPANQPSGEYTIDMTVTVVAQ